MTRFNLLLVVTILVALTGCANAPEATDAPVRPVLVVGIDGLEWDVMIPLLAEGRLPHFAALMDGGTFGYYETFKPTKSPIIWTSMATGLEGERHGIQGFMTGSAREAGSRLYDNRDRRVRAVWNILSDHGMRSAVIGWWMTYPVEEIDGVMVAQTNTSKMEDESKIWKGTLYEGVENQVHPPDRQQEILDVVPGVEKELDGIVREIFGEVPGEALGPAAMKLWDKSFWAFRADETYRRVSLKLLADDEPYDLFMTYLGGTDVVGHRFWRYMHPDDYTHRPSDEEIRVLGDVIADYYVHTDSLLGEIVAAAPADANILVVSDHGMVGTFHDREFHAGLSTGRMRSGGHSEAPPGVLIAKGPAIPASGSVKGLKRESLPTLGSVLDLAPTVLALLNVPVGRDMDGKVMDDVVAKTWLRSHPVRYVDTHTPAGWFEARSQAKQGEDSIESQERVEQLRALGYLED